MKKYLFAVLAAAMPVFAQDAAPQECPMAPQCKPAPCCKKMDPAKCAEFAKKREEWKQQREARRAQFVKMLLEKFDADKNGQLNEQELSAMMEEGRKHMHKRGHRRHHGHHRGHGRKCGKGMGPKCGPRHHHGPKCDKPCPMMAPQCPNAEQAPAPAPAPAQPAA